MRRLKIIHSNLIKLMDIIIQVAGRAGHSLDLTDNTEVGENNNLVV